MVIKKTKLKKNGFTLVELLVSIALFSLLAGVMTTTMTSLLKNNISISFSSDGARILDESYEIVRSLRDQNFLYLQNGTYQLRQQNETWNLIPDTGVDEIPYNRKVTIEDLYRDGYGNKAEEGSVDPRSKLVTLEVEWDSIRGGTESLTSQIILTDWSSTDILMSSLANWADGTFVQSRVNQTGNALELDGTITSWTSQRNEQINREWFEENFNANANALAIGGNKGYVATNNQGSKGNFIVIDTTAPNNILKLGALNIGNGVDVLDVTILGNYAYLATNKESAELMVINIIKPQNPQIAGIYNAPTNTRALTIENDGRYIHLGLAENDQQEWIILTPQTAQIRPTAVQSIEINANVNDIAIDQSRAYLAVEDEDNPLRIFQLNTPNAPISEQIPDGLPDSPGRSVLAYENKIYVGTKKIDSAQELFLISRLEDNNLELIHGLEIGESVRGLEYYNQQLFVTSSKHHEELKIIDLTNPENMELKENVDLNATGNRPTATPEALFVPTNNNDNAGSLLIFTYPIESFAPSGTFTAAPLDSQSSTTVWKSLTWEGTLPSQTAVSFQLKTADTQSNLATADWTGPDGTSNTAYTANTNIITTNPNSTGTQWLQYKLILTSQNPEETPQVTSIRLQYAP